VKEEDMAWLQCGRDQVVAEMLRCKSHMMSKVCALGCERLSWDHREAA